ncbi:uncharacterized protein LOC141910559 [Tubulanus polymorphus]|uniref:uncharacterized protein LOC141910559 n=1 Tax=Tubulanus polymorphus TaxID=672921 RepID=UPI003DA427EA
MIPGPTEEAALKVKTIEDKLRARFTESTSVIHKTMVVYFQILLQSWQTMFGTRMKELDKKEKKEVETVFDMVSTLISRHWKDVETKKLQTEVKQWKKLLSKAGKGKTGKEITDHFRQLKKLASAANDNESKIPLNPEKIKVNGDQLIPLLHGEKRLYADEYKQSQQRYKRRLEVTYVTKEIERVEEITYIPVDAIGGAVSPGVRVVTRSVIVDGEELPEENETHVIAKKKPRTVDESGTTDSDEDKLPSKSKKGDHKKVKKWTETSEKTETRPVRNGDSSSEGGVGDDMVDDSIVKEIAVIKMIPNEPVSVTISDSKSIQNSEVIPTEGDGRNGAVEVEEDMDVDDNTRQPMVQKRTVLRTTTTTTRKETYTMSGDEDNSDDGKKKAPDGVEFDSSVTALLKGDDNIPISELDSNENGQVSILKDDINEDEPITTILTSRSLVSGDEGVTLPQSVDGGIVYKTQSVYSSRVDGDGVDRERIVETSSVGTDDGGADRRQVSTTTTTRTIYGEGRLDSSEAGTTPSVDRFGNVVTKEVTLSTQVGPVGEDDIVSAASPDGKVVEEKEKLTTTDRFGNKIVTTTKTKSISGADSPDLSDRAGKEVRQTTLVTKMELVPDDGRRDAFDRYPTSSEVDQADQITRSPTGRVIVGDGTGDARSRQIDGARINKTDEFGNVIQTVDNSQPNRDSSGQTLGPDDDENSQWETDEFGNRIRVRTTRTTSSADGADIGNVIQSMTTEGYDIGQAGEVNTETELDRFGNVVPITTTTIYGTDGAPDVGRQTDKFGQRATTDTIPYGMREGPADINERPQGDGKDLDRFGNVVITTRTTETIYGRGDAPDGGNHTDKFGQSLTTDTIPYGIGQGLGDIDGRPQEDTRDLNRFSNIVTTTTPTEIVYGTDGAPDGGGQTDRFGQSVTADKSQYGIEQGPGETEDQSQGDVRELDRFGNVITTTRTTETNYVRDDAPDSRSQNDRFGQRASTDTIPYGMREGPGDIDERPQGDNKELDRFGNVVTTTRKTETVYGRDDAPDSGSQTDEFDQRATSGAIPYGIGQEAMDTDERQQGDTRDLDRFGNVVTTTRTTETVYGSDDVPDGGNQIDGFGQRLSTDTIPYDIRQGPGERPQGDVKNRDRFGNVVTTTRTTETDYGRDDAPDSRSQNDRFGERASTDTIPYGMGEEPGDIDGRPQGDNKELDRFGNVVTTTRKTETVYGRDDAPDSGSQTDEFDQRATSGAIPYGIGQEAMDTDERQQGGTRDLDRFGNVVTTTRTTETVYGSDEVPDGGNQIDGFGKRVSTDTIPYDIGQGPGERSQGDVKDRDRFGNVVTTTRTTETVYGRDDAPDSRSQNDRFGQRASTDTIPYGMGEGPGDIDGRPQGDNKELDRFGNVVTTTRKTETVYGRDDAPDSGSQTDEFDQRATSGAIPYGIGQEAMDTDERRQGGTRDLDRFGNVVTSTRTTETVYGSDYVPDGGSQNDRFGQRVSTDTIPYDEGQGPGERPQGDVKDRDRFGNVVTTTKTTETVYGRDPRVTAEQTYSVLTEPETDRFGNIITTTQRSMTTYGREEGKGTDEESGNERDKFGNLVVTTRTTETMYGGVIYPDETGGFGQTTSTQEPIAMHGISQEPKDDATGEMKLGNLEEPKTDRFGNIITTTTTSKAIYSDGTSARERKDQEVPERDRFGNVIPTRKIDGYGYIENDENDQQAQPETDRFGNIVTNQKMSRNDNDDNSPEEDVKGREQPETVRDRFGNVITTTTTKTISDRGNLSTDIDRFGQIITTTTSTSETTYDTEELEGKGSDLGQPGTRTLRSDDQEQEPERERQEQTETERDRFGNIITTTRTTDTVYGRETSPEKEREDTGGYGRKPDTTRTFGSTYGPGQEPEETVVEEKRQVEFTEPETDRFGNVITTTQTTLRTYGIDQDVDDRQQEISETEKDKFGPTTTRTTRTVGSMYGGGQELDKTEPETDRFGNVATDTHPSRKDEQPGQTEIDRFGNVAPTGTTEAVYSEENSQDDPGRFGQTTTRTTRTVTSIGQEPDETVTDKTQDVLAKPEADRFGNVITATRTTKTIYDREISPETDREEWDQPEVDRFGNVVTKAKATDAVYGKEKSSDEPERFGQTTTRTARTVSSMYGIGQEPEESVTADDDPVDITESETDRFGNVVTITTSKTAYGARTSGEIEENQPEIERDRFENVITTTQTRTVYGREKMPGNEEQEQPETQGDRFGQTTTRTTRTVSSVYGIGQEPEGAVYDERTEEEFKGPETDRFGNLLTTTRTSRTVYDDVIPASDRDLEQPVTERDRFGNMVTTTQTSRTLSDREETPDGYEDDPQHLLGTERDRFGNVVTTTRSLETVSNHGKFSGETDSSGLTTRTTRTVNSAYGIDGQEPEETGTEEMTQGDLTETQIDRFGNVITTTITSKTIYGAGVPEEDIVHGQPDNGREGSRNVITTIRTARTTIGGEQISKNDEASQDDQGSEADRLVHTKSKTIYGRDETPENEGPETEGNRLGQTTTMTTRTVSSMYGIDQEPEDTVTEEKRNEQLTEPETDRFGNIVTTTTTARTFYDVQTPDDDKNEDKPETVRIKFGNVITTTKTMQLEPDKENSPDEFGERISAVSKEPKETVDNETTQEEFTEPETDRFGRIVIETPEAPEDDTTRSRTTIYGRERAPDNDEPTHPETEVDRFGQTTTRTTRTVSSMYGIGQGPGETIPGEITQEQLREPETDRFGNMITTTTTSTTVFGAEIPEDERDQLQLEPGRGRFGTGSSMYGVGREPDENVTKEWTEKQLTEPETDRFGNVITSTRTSRTVYDSETPDDVGDQEQPVTKLDRFGNVITTTKTTHGREQTPELDEREESETERDRFGQTTTRTTRTVSSMYGIGREPEEGVAEGNEFTEPETDRFGNVITSTIVANPDETDKPQPRIDRDRFGNVRTTTHTTRTVYGREKTPENDEQEQTETEGGRFGQSTTRTTRTVSSMYGVGQEPEGDQAQPVTERDRSGNVITTTRTTHGREQTPENDEQGQAKTDSDRFGQTTTRTIRTVSSLYGIGREPDETVTEEKSQEVLAEPGGTDRFGNIITTTSSRTDYGVESQGETDGTQPEIERDRFGNVITTTRTTRTIYSREETPENDEQEKPTTERDRFGQTTTKTTRTVNSMYGIGQEPGETLAEGTHGDLTEPETDSFGNIITTRTSRTVYGYETPEGGQEQPVTERDRFGNVITTTRTTHGREQTLENDGRKQPESDRDRFGQTTTRTTRAVSSMYGIGQQPGETVTGEKIHEVLTEPETDRFGNIIATTTSRTVYGDQHQEETGKDQPEIERDRFGNVITTTRTTRTIYGEQTPENDDQEKPETDRDGFGQTTTRTARDVSSMYGIGQGSEETVTEEITQEQSTEPETDRFGNIVTTTRTSRSVYGFEAPDEERDQMQPEDERDRFGQTTTTTTRTVSSMYGVGQGPEETVTEEITQEQPTEPETDRFGNIVTTTRTSRTVYGFEAPDEERDQMQPEDERDRFGQTTTTTTRTVNSMYGVGREPEESVTEEKTQEEFSEPETDRPERDRFGNIVTTTKVSLTGGDEPDVDRVGRATTRTTQEIYGITGNKPDVSQTEQTVIVKTERFGNKITSGGEIDITESDRRRYGGFGESSTDADIASSTTTVTTKRMYGLDDNDNDGDKEGYSETITETRYGIEQSEVPSEVVDDDRWRSDSGWRDRRTITETWKTEEGDGSRPDDLVAKDAGDDEKWKTDRGWSDTRTVTERWKTGTGDDSGDGGVDERKEGGDDEKWRSDGGWSDTRTVTERWRTREAGDGDDASGGGADSRRETRRLGRSDSQTDRDRDDHAITKRHSFIKAGFDGGAQRLEIQVRAPEDSASLQQDWGEEKMISLGEREEMELAESEQVLQSKGEVTQTFFVEAVIDPRNDEAISLDDARALGIIDSAHGQYVNIQTGRRIPIPQAMSEQKIIITYETKSETEEPSKSYGIIKIKHLHARPASKYKIHHVIHPVTNRVLTLSEATAQNVVDEALTTYRNPKSGNEIPLSEAIEKMKVLADEQDENEQPKTPLSPGPDYEPDSEKTYVVSAVVDRLQKRRVSFREAANIGLLDQLNGTFKDNVTGESMFIGDAIHKGFLKVRELDSKETLDIDPTNHVVVSRVNMLKKKILNPLKAIRAFRSSRLSTTHEDEESHA